MRNHAPAHAPPAFFLGGRDGRKLIPLQTPPPLCLAPTMQHATPVNNMFFLARLEFLYKAGCVLHYFQYNRGHALILVQNSSLNFLADKFLSVLYVKQRSGPHISCTTLILPPTPTASETLAPTLTPLKAYRLVHLKKPKMHYPANVHAVFSIQTMKFCTRPLCVLAKTSRDVCVFFLPDSSSR